MTGNEPGWYRDPAPPHLEDPTTLRYWDGTGWTTEVKPATRAQRDQWLREDAEARYALALAELVPPDEDGNVVVTPALLKQLRAEELSGWWRRVAAYVLDSLLAGLLATLLSWPWLMEVARAYGAFFQTVLATPPGAPIPSPDALFVAVAGPLAMMGLVSLVVRFVYDVGFLKAVAATPGKLVLGIQVRRLAEPGVLPWGTILVRWVAQNPSAFVRLVPAGPLVLVLTLVVSIYSLADSLWPLGDRNHQSIHDKAARTVVVRR